MRWGLSWCASVAPICNAVIQMAAALRFPIIRGRDVSPILLRQIIKDIDSTPEDFLRHR